MIFSWDAVDWGFIVISGELTLLLVFAGIYLAISVKTLKRKLIAVALTLVMPVLLSLLVIGEAYGPWQVAAEGVYDHADYTGVQQKKLPVGYYTVPYTIIHFADGRTYVMTLFDNVPFEKGAPIRILEKNGKYKIERRD